MFCTNCRNQLLDNARFCAECGESIEQPIEKPVSVPAPEPNPVPVPVPTSKPVSELAPVSKPEKKKRKTKVLLTVLSILTVIVLNFASWRVWYNLCHETVYLVDRMYSYDKNKAPYSQINYTYDKYGNVEITTCYIPTGQLLWEYNYVNDSNSNLTSEPVFDIIEILTGYQTSQSAYNPSTGMPTETLFDSDGNLIGYCEYAYIEAAVKELK